jgi:4-alpha-glucanotransferase
MNCALPNLVRFGREICGDLQQAERREWWLANGHGSHAAGTVAGSLTRRYHGLLVAPVDTPLGRMFVLAKADAVLTDGGRHWSVACALDAWLRLEQAKREQAATGDRAHAASA